ncbi:hypothetical protein K450DRAFT_271274 [Umbelopsis ramanniana AG]|uniref:Uncharacterized protein n=1 Tax=Umbelopsis ramanniana AG TaxID=1314678 RepID=A0AAD5EDB6_UMBRA|nr:uncharacterized protein K450DRAFT_271274 [Umbelopsis ramanniana AG]KAI8580165.1 hypothetical protein K450DRAFT_271274 [Umbelopsis ramanniana AG]
MNAYKLGCSLVPWKYKKQGSTNIKFKWCIINTTLFSSASFRLGTVDEYEFGCLLAPCARRKSQQISDPSSVLLALTLQTHPSSLVVPRHINSAVFLHLGQAQEAKANKYQIHLNFQAWRTNAYKLSCLLAPWASARAKSPQI